MLHYMNRLRCVLEDESLCVEVETEKEVDENFSSQKKYERMVRLLNRVASYEVCGLRIDDDFLEFYTKQDYSSSFEEVYIFKDDDFERPFFIIIKLRR